MPVGAHSEWELLKAFSRSEVHVICVQVCECYSGDTNKLSVGMTSAKYFAVTLTFDLVSSKCNCFICVPSCTKLVNLVKISQAVYKISLPRCLFDHISSCCDLEL